MEEPVLILEVVSSARAGARTERKGWHGGAWVADAASEVGIVIFAGVLLVARRKADVTSGEWRFGRGVDRRRKEG